MAETLKARAGHFYAVGLGPGSGDLLTVRATRVIRSADVIIAPCSPRGGESLALKIAGPFVRGKKIIEHRYVMERDRKRVLESWSAAAGRAAKLCRSGKSVAHITIGDPLLYGTTCYMLDAMRRLIGPAKVHAVPGIPAFLAAGAILGEALAVQDDRVTVMPADRLDDVRKALKNCETLVLYKCAAKLPQLMKILGRRGLLERAAMVCCAEQPARQLVLNPLLNGVPPERQGYMATIIVHIGRRSWQSGPAKRRQT